MPALAGHFPGCPLTISFESSANAVETAKKKRNLLPLLTGLFVFSYGLMTMLIVEQGATIQSQSNLIKVLLPESRELWGLKGKAISDKQRAKVLGQEQKQAAQPPAAEQHAPGAQAGTQAQPQNKAAKTVKPQSQFPPIPASDLDPRRAVHTI